ncbi:MAG: YkgJ family cysteine cluster protein [Sphingomonas sp.]
MTAVAQAEPAPGRSCGGCTLCCKVMEVTELAKPPGQWCGHCAVGKGCGIYAERPLSCRTYMCVYLVSLRAGPHWYPARSKMVITMESTGRTVVRVDAGRPAVWREEPYYSDLKRWAVQGGSGHQLLVVTAGRTIAILPQADVDLGAVTSEDLLLTTEYRTSKGPRWTVEKIDADDPRAAGLEPGSRP